MSAIVREVTLGNCRLIQGDCLEVMKSLNPVDHFISDPPYEDSLHQSKQQQSALRVDGGPELRAIEFAGVNSMRADIVSHGVRLVSGWFIVFCTMEGVARWADAINPSNMKYKRACVWIKPDSAPQFNGQGPAQGAECFVAAWAGGGFSHWNGGGKRGVYRHLVGPPDRHGSHPTEKPWRLMSEIVDDFTNAGEVVLDPFMGSGSTGVACVKRGRQFIGIEDNPEYFNIALQRIAQAQLQGDFLLPSIVSPSKQEVLL